MCSPDALCASAGEILEAVGARDDVDDARLLDRLAGVARLELGQLLVALAQDCGGTAQDAGTLAARERTPGRLRCARGADGGLDLGGAGDRDVAEPFSGRGIDGNQPRFCETIVGCHKFFVCKE